MERPEILRGDLPTRLLQGAAVGAIATLVIGFYWGGWVTGGSAKEMVQRSSSLRSSQPFADLRRQVPAERERRDQHGRAQEGQLVPAGHLHREGRLGHLAGQRQCELVGGAGLRHHAQQSEVGEYPVAQRRPATGSARRASAEGRTGCARHGTDVSQPEPQLRRDPARGPLLGPRQRDGMVVLRHRGRVAAGRPRDGARRGRHAGRVRFPSGSICAAASRVYSRGRKGSYELGAADL